LRNSICLISFFCLAYSCAHENKNKDASESNPPVSDSVAAELAGTLTLSPPEFRRYSGAVENYMEAKFNNRRFNGSVLVAKNGQILYEKYQGYTNPRAKKDSITSSTPFHLASVSKTITATAILKLSEECRLNINDSVSKYLIGFPCVGVTIKTLLNHRSGLPNYVHYMEVLGWDKRKLITNQDVLDFIIQRHNEIQIGPPDRHFSYSNTNYALLALIIEKVTGQSYGSFIKLKIFDPLEMKNSFVFTMSDSARALPSFFFSGRQYPFDFLDLVYGDKNVYSTVRDMLKFDQALRSGKLLKPETMQTAYSGYSFEKPGINNYGLGWRMFILKNGKKLIYHNGWWHGNRTAFYRLIDEKVTIIALCNNDYKKVYMLKKLANIFGDYLHRDKDDVDIEIVKIRRLNHYISLNEIIETR